MSFQYDLCKIVPSVVCLDDWHGVAPAHGLSSGRHVIEGLYTDVRRYKKAVKMKT